MKIVVVDFAANTGGATSILKSFYQYLIDSHDENEWVFLLSDNYVCQTQNIKVMLLQKEKKSRVRRMLFDYIYGRNVLNQLQPDVVFYLQNTLIHGVRCKQVAYMDQPIPFQKTANFSFLDPKQRSLAIYQHIIGIMIRNACKNADEIIVQTEWMRDAIANKCGVNIEHVYKVAPEIHLDYRPTGNEDFNCREFIFPANYIYYKNHRCVIRAAEILEEKGITDYQIHFTIERDAVDCKCSRQIVFDGSIPHKEVLKALSSQTLIFPSYVETYGLPLAEARCMNAVILAADTEFAREILNGYDNAYFFPAFSPQKLAELIEAVVSGRIKRKNEKALMHNGEDGENGWAKVVRLMTR